MSSCKYSTTLKKLSDESFDKTKSYFNFLDKYELDLLKNNALLRVMNFIENSITYLNYKQFTIVKAKTKKYSCGDYMVTTEDDTAIYSPEKGSKRVNQNELYLDFLIMKSTDGEIRTKHYKEMVQQLKGNFRYIDRVFLANRMTNKINVQFDSNVKRFIYGNDGAMERIHDLVNSIRYMDFSKVKPYPSNFCQYCIVSDICMGSKESQKKGGLFGTEN